MKLCLLASVVMTVAVGMMTGCGPGLSHRAKAPTDVFEAMDAELSNAIVGTTTVTSAPLQAMPLPESRMSVAAAAEAPAPAMQTWGGSDEPAKDPSYSEEYGF